MSAPGQMPTPAEIAYALKGLRPHHPTAYDVIQRLAAIAKGLPKAHGAGAVTEAMANLINDVQEWCDAVERGTSWDYWDHHYKHLAYGGLDAYRAILKAAALRPDEAAGQGEASVRTKAERIANGQWMNTFDKSALIRAIVDAFATPRPEASDAPDIVPVESIHEYVAGYEFRFDNGGGYTPTDAERAMLEDAINGYVTDALAALRAELAAVTRERDNLQARLTARAKSMNALRLRLASVHDNIEDEGDRAYFGSTNDADTFKEVWQDLDAWEWDDIMEDGKLPDVYEASRKAHTRAEAAEAEVSRLKGSEAAWEETRTAMAHMRNENNQLKARIRELETAR